ncbi:hypothetical protein KC19_5G061900 [Ceratodon purpureus]|uniref:Uncharacterized protein n=1 Tax=Ceratodon purpureus TaxID=3225 RepID=A0A8T0HYF3_CERPU|nr:hypothetical protein KC19_5G061900 [Ceratodon purpureus]
MNRLVTELQHVVHPSLTCFIVFLCSAEDQQLRVVHIRRLVDSNKVVNSPRSANSSNLALDIFTLLVFAMVNLVKEAFEESIFQVDSASTAKIYCWSLTRPYVGFY